MLILRVDWLCVRARVRICLSDNYFSTDCTNADYKWSRQRADRNQRNSDNEGEARGETGYPKVAMTTS